MANDFAYNVEARRMQGCCMDCGRKYGDEFGFPDLVVSPDVWKAIAPTRDEGGLLCPSCMCRRAANIGLENVKAEFRSGPFCRLAAAPEAQTRPESPPQQERLVCWNEPLCTKPNFVAGYIAKAPESEVIRAQKGNFPERNYTDKEALDEFMVVSWAWFEEPALTRASASRHPRTSEKEEGKI